MKAPRSISDFYKKRLSARISAHEPNFSAISPDLCRIKRIGFLGAGKSNLSVLRVFRSLCPSAEFILRCDKDTAGQASEFDKCYFGNSSLCDINEELLFLSPSVRRDRREIADAAARGVYISSDCELFFSLTDGAAFGVTGSDGKSTTTSALAAILSEAGYPAVACGNFGLPLCELFGKRVLPIAELSSFQLSYAKPVLDTAIITNITENHLDWHKSFDEYRSVKLSIFKRAKRAVIDADCAELIKGAPAEKLFCAVTLKKSCAEIKSLLPAKYVISAEGERILLNGVPFAESAALLSMTEYNVKNFCLACGAALEYASASDMQRAAEKFAALPHRCRVVTQFGKTRYIDSSIDTTPARTAATLTAQSGEAVAILCGRSKGGTLTPLADALISHTVGAVVFGEIAENILTALSSDTRFEKYPVRAACGMRDAVRIATKMLTRGGTVILSPSGTSFDLYSSFEERGDDFAREALALCAELGEAGPRGTCTD